MVKSISIFEAGSIGKVVFHVRQDEKYGVHFFIDNEEKKWGSKLNGVPIIDLETYIKRGGDCDIYVCCKVMKRDTILRQLSKAGSQNVSSFDNQKIWALDRHERVLAYSHVSDLEDIILWYGLVQKCS